MKILSLQNNINSINHNPRKPKENRASNQEKTYDLLTTLSFCANYNVNKIDKKFDEDKLKSLNIPNFQVINGHSVRGESLSSKKNRKFIKAIKKCGITDIIDLRDKYSSSHFQNLCDEAGIRYHQIPVDASSVDTEELIGNLPELFETLNDKNTYISCAQGLHRTDIALALNYMFNPKKQKKPPVMYGHFRNYGFKFDDIMQRVNSVKRILTAPAIGNLGWQTDQFEDQFKARKKSFVDFNRQMANNQYLNEDK